MYKVMVVSEAGACLTEAETDALVLLYASEQGVAANSIIETDWLTALDMLVSMDIMKKRIMAEHPELERAYKKRKKIIKGMTEVDLSALRALIKRRGKEDE